MDDIDHPFTDWTLTWVSEQLKENPLNLFDANIFYPNENTLAYSDHLFSSVLLFAPVYYITGNPILSQNILIIFSYIFSALGAFCLVYYYTKKIGPSFVAGVIFSFCSYKVWNMGHFQNLTVWWIPFTILFLHKFFENTKRTKYLVLFSLCFLMQILASWYHAVFIAIPLALVFAYEYWSKGIKIKSLTSVRVIISFAIVSIIVLVFGYPYLGVFSASGGYSINEIVSNSADLFSYILPSPNTFLAKFIPVFDLKKHWTENFLYVGFSTVIIVFSVLIVRIRKKKVSIDGIGRLYLILMFLGFILSLGPVLIVLDRYTYIPLPYSLVLHFVKYLGFIRVTARYAIVFFFGLSVFVGLLLNSIDKYISRTRISFIIYMLLGIIIFVDFVPTRYFARYKDFSEVPEVYTWLAENKKGVVVEIPSTEKTAHDILYTYYSIYHMNNIVNGYSGGYPEGYPQTMETIESFPSSESIEKMEELDVKYLVIHCSRKVMKDNAVCNKTEDLQSFGFQFFEYSNGDILVVLE